MRVYDITTQGLPCIFKLTSFLDTPSFRDSIACELNLTPHGWTDFAFLTKRRFWGLQMSTFNVEEQLHYERSRRYASIAYSLTPVFSLTGVIPSLDSKSGFEYLCGTAIILILLKSRI